jgi:hypothetical protein
MEKQAVTGGNMGASGRQNPAVSGEAAGTGISDLAFDWLTILQNKAKALRAYDTYINDARRANASECVSLLERIRDADRRQVEEIKRHMEAVLGESGEHATGGASMSAS